MLNAFPVSTSSRARVLSLSNHHSIVFDSTLQTMSSGLQGDWNWGIVTAFCLMSTTEVAYRFPKTGLCSVNVLSDVMMEYVLLVNSI